MFSNTKVLDRPSEHSINSPSTVIYLDSLSTPMFFTARDWTAVIWMPLLPIPRLAL